MVHEKDMKITKTVGRTKEDTVASCQNRNAPFISDAIRMFYRTFDCFTHSDKKTRGVVLFIISFESSALFLRTALPIYILYFLFSLSGQHQSLPHTTALSSSGPAPKLFFCSCTTSHTTFLSDVSL